jgi:hypothetical protein
MYGNIFSADQYAVHQINGKFYDKEAPESVIVHFLREDNDVFPD